MYKGKFDQKKKGGNVQDILSQRSQPAPADFPELKPAPKKEPQTQKRPVQSPPQKPQGAAPQKAAPQKPAPRQKKGPRLGGVIFYTIYFLFILVFCIATFVGLLWIRGWLVEYEASQPTVKSEQVFTQLFTDPDWDALYQASGAQDSPYEGKDAYVSYMEEKVGDQALTYLKTSAGLSGDKKYLVRLGNETVASFTLVDKNKVGDTTTLQNLTKLPDWQLGRVDVFFERSGSYRIEKVADHIAYVNGVALGEDAIIQKATTKAEQYLPAGVTSAKTYTLEVDGLMRLPTVTVTDKQGNPMDVTYDEDTRTFTERNDTNSITPEEQGLAIDTTKSYMLYMIEQADKGDLAKYFDTTGAAYKRIIKFESNRWMQGSSGHEFANAKVSNYERYSEDLFSCRVVMDLNVTRTDGSVKNYPNDQTLFFHKTSAGKWKAFEMTNEDVSAPQGQVRLTFMEGQNVVLTNFFATDASKIITPIISVPEGKVFSGWVREDVDESGSKTLSLIFQPDETGTASIPEGMDLLPMTLYPLFENPGDVTVPETAPETVETTEGAE